MNIAIVCIGKLKERYWTEAVSEYAKRLGKYCALTIRELKEERLADGASKAEEVIVKAAEGRAVLNAVREDAYLVALDINGSMLSSEQLADKLQALGASGKSSVAFVIGGSIGLSDEVLARADLRLSFSKMTFPHQMMRVVLLEQIYRSFRIIRNEPYHK